MKKHLGCLLFVLVIIFQSQFISAQNTSPYWSLTGNNNATSTGSKLGTTNAVNLGLFTNNIERIRILSTNGNVGIGTLTPTERLRIAGPAGMNPFRVQVNDVTKFMINQNGGVSIGNSTVPPVNGLYVAGKVGLGVKDPTARLELAGSSGFVTLLKLTNGNIRVESEFSDGDESMTGVWARGFTGVTGEGWNGIKGSGVVGVYGFGGAIGIRGVSESGGPAYGAVEGFGLDGIGGLFKATGPYTSLRVEAGGSYAAEFYGTVWASNGFITSDRNLKQDVSDFQDAMSIIGKLKPRHYEFKTDAQYAFLHLPAGTHYGLLAQDVEQVLPNLVSTANHQALDRDLKSQTGSPVRYLNPASISPKQPANVISVKAVNYVELIPIMIKAMQEQQSLNDTLREQLADQQKQLTELRQIIHELKRERNAALSSTGAYLEQNAPNPVRSSTAIRYYIAESISSAHLTLTNAEGQVLKNVTITSRGSAQLHLEANTLPVGTYNYTLYADGQQVDTKTLIIAR